MTRHVRKRDAHQHPPWPIKCIIRWVIIYCLFFAIHILIHEPLHRQLFEEIQLQCSSFSRSFIERDMNICLECFSRSFSALISLVRLRGMNIRYLKRSTSFNGRIQWFARVVHLSNDILTNPLSNQSKESVGCVLLHLYLFHKSDMHWIDDPIGKQLLSSCFSMQKRALFSLLRVTLLRHCSNDKRSDCLRWLDSVGQHFCRRRLN